MTTKQQRIRDNFERNNFRNELVWLNAGNETGKIQIAICESLLKQFPDEELIGLEIGSAYGGAVEFMAKCWYGRGRVYGYDTFKGHPRDLAVHKDNLEAWCMDFWYNQGKHIKELNKSRLNYDYQRKVLDKQLLNNATLVKGRVNKHSFDDIKKIHFAMLDLDLIKPTRIAYDAIKDKFVPDAYLFMHDSLPADHLPMIYHFVYDEILKDGRWQLMNYDTVQAVTGLFTVLKRRFR